MVTAGNAPTLVWVSTSWGVGLIVSLFCREAGAAQRQEPGTLGVNQYVRHECKARTTSPRAILRSSVQTWTGWMEVKPQGTVVGHVSEDLLTYGIPTCPFPHRALAYLKIRIISRSMTNTWAVRKDSVLIGAKLQVLVSSRKAENCRQLLHLRIKLIILADDCMHQNQ